MFISHKFILRPHFILAVSLFLLSFCLFDHQGLYAEEVISKDKTRTVESISEAGKETDTGVSGVAGDVVSDSGVSEIADAGTVQRDKKMFDVAAVENADTDSSVIAANEEIAEFLADREDNIRSLRSLRSYDIASDLLDPFTEPVLNRIAILPFENYTDIYDTADMVFPELRNRLEAMGYEIIDPVRLNDFLCRHRVRETGFVSKNLARALRNKFGVKAVMVGSVVLFSTGGEPQLGLISRLVDSSNGAILWASYSSAIGYDYTSILGFGRIRLMEKLLPKVVEGLLSSFSTEAPYKEIESTYRLAVMPFQNNSGHKDAGMIASQLFVVSLFNSEGFDPVEYGEIKKQVFDLRIRSKAGLDYKSMQDLRDATNVDGFLLGNVELYNEGKLMKTPPKAAVTARLLDARDKRIVWYDRYQMRGDDDIIVLDWKKLMTVDKVAGKIVSRLVDKMERIEWQ